MADTALTAIAGSPSRVYDSTASTNGKIVGPVGVAKKEGGVSISVKKVSGSGSIGSYQPQQSDDPDGPWENLGSAISSAGSQSLDAQAAYVRVVPATPPGASTVVRVSLRTEE